MKKVMSILFTSILMLLGLQPLQASSHHEARTFLIRVDILHTTQSFDSGSETDFFAIFDSRVQQRLRTRVIRNQNFVSRPGWEYIWREIFPIAEENGSSVHIKIYDRDKKWLAKDDLLIEKSIFFFPYPSGERDCLFVVDFFGPEGQTVSGNRVNSNYGVPGDPCYQIVELKSEPDDRRPERIVTARVRLEIR